MAQQRRGGLGKGLGALIPTGPIVEAAGGTGTVPEAAPVDDGPKPVAGAYFMEIPVKSITRNPRQPREIFDEDAITELADSIREVGLLQPIVVRSLGEGNYELIMGERRWRASKLLGLDEIPAIVRNTQDDAMLRDALIENLQREQLNALEEAAAYRQLLDDFGATHEQLAQRVGRSRSHITNTLRLLNLPGNVQLRVAAGTISAGHARALLTLSDPAAQEHLASRIVAEGLSVRTVEEIVSMGEATAAPAPRARRAKDAPDPTLAHLAHRLSDHFETRVKVDLGRRKGRIVVEFASMDDLERIISAMAPGAALED
ncbi:chromosome partitioning protein ParB [Sphaerisporangium krabiense]|uniref:ParB family chromosome partitioning protein n=1 Tax=Sphaerisporangium krabiense TaxID=763782 RepID=A0A7W8Z3E5_9ACTN|nr:ParB/RepB/Spo0J family partition protein [Sphaerisporangium krabiense]MBB5626428.1 ParB family chromosome partitioning protein [Sphaerisporangium krabiense]GII63347.1 chromosome partitioning protein ParB [Sphaerisporangium krabiense]